AEHRDRRHGAKLAPLEIEARSADQLAVSVHQHEVLERRMQRPEIEEQLVIGAPVDLRAHHGPALRPRRPLFMRQLFSPPRALPPSFHFSSLPFTRSSPTVSPRVFTLGRAVSDGGRGRRPSSSNTAARASAAATPWPSATLSATPNPSCLSSAQ